MQYDKQPETRDLWWIYEKTISVGVVRNKVLDYIIKDESGIIRQALDFISCSHSYSKALGDRYTINFLFPREKTTGITDGDFLKIFFSDIHLCRMDNHVKLQMIKYSYEPNDLVLFNLSVEKSTSQVIGMMFKSFNQLYQHFKERCSVPLYILIEAIK